MIGTQRHVICVDRTLQETKMKNLNTLFYGLAEAFAVLDIIQDNQKDFKKLDEPMTLEKEGTYRKYLLEYRRSHACCNQLKSNTSFLHWKDRNYVINELVLRNFFARLHSVIGGTKFHSEERVCGNKNLNLQKERNKKTFIENRTEDVTRNYLQPIAKFVNENRYNKGKNMMELSYLVVESGFVSASSYMANEKEGAIGR